MKPCIKCGGTDKYTSGQCKACMKAYNKAYRQAKADKILKQKKIHYQANINKIREQQKICYQNNWEARKAYRQANADRGKKYNKAYYRKNPQKGRDRRQKHRATIAKVPSLPYDFDSICKQYGYICLCCKRSDKPLTIDHIIPISQGGFNTKKNIQPLCHSCNSSKGNRHCTDYRPDVGKPIITQLSLEF